MKRKTITVSGPTGIFIVGDSLEPKYIKIVDGKIIKEGNKLEDVQ